LTALGRDSGNTNVARRTFIPEQKIATQNTDVTLCTGGTLLPKGVKGYLIRKAPMAGPADNPKQNTPVKRENICAREPSDVQSDMYAMVAVCRADQPPRRPSIIGLMIRNLCPCVEKGVCGVETSIKIKSLQEKTKGRGQSHRNEEEYQLYKRQEKAKRREGKDTGPSMAFAEITPPTTCQSG
jgi:hypothetical protein